MLGGNDVDAAVRQLKSDAAGDVVVLGSWTLIESLIAWDLVDEYRFFLHPLVRGMGKRLFRPLGRPRKMTLAGHP